MVGTVPWNHLTLAEVHPQKHVASELSFGLFFLSIFIWNLVSHRNAFFLSKCRKCNAVATQISFEKWKRIRKSRSLTTLSFPSTGYSTCLATCTGNSVLEGIVAHTHKTEQKKRAESLLCQLLAVVTLLQSVLTLLYQKKSCACKRCQCWNLHLIVDSYSFQFSSSDLKEVTNH